MSVDRETAEAQRFLVESALVVSGFEPDHHIDALRRIIDALFEKDGLSYDRRASLLNRFLVADRLSTSVLVNGVAIPHLAVGPEDWLPRRVGWFLASRPISFGADARPVGIIFCLTAGRDELNLLLGHALQILDAPELAGVRDGRGLDAAAFRRISTSVDIGDSTTFDTRPQDEWTHSVRISLMGGLHTAPAFDLACMASTHDCTAEVRLGDRRADASDYKAVFDLASATFAPDCPESTLWLRARGPDAAEFLDEASERFGRDD